METGWGRTDLLCLLCLDRTLTTRSLTSPVNVHICIQSKTICFSFPSCEFCSSWLHFVHVPNHPHFLGYYIITPTSPGSWEKIFRLRSFPLAPATESMCLRFWLVPFVCLFLFLCLSKEYNHWAYRLNIKYDQILTNSLRVLIFEVSHVRWERSASDSKRREKLKCRDSVPERGKLRKQLELRTSNHKGHDQSNSQYNIQEMKDTGIHSDVIRCFISRFSNIFSWVCALTWFMSEV